MFPALSAHRGSHPFSLLATLAGIALFAATGTAEATELFHFHHENVLGTSLDLQIAAAENPQHVRSGERD